MNRLATTVILVVNVLLVPAASAASPPSEPRELEAAYNEATNTMELSWLPPTSDGGSPVMEYEVFANGVLVATVTATEALLSDPPLAALYSVRAVNEEGTGPAAHATGGSGPKCFGFIPPDVTISACEQWVREHIPLPFWDAIDDIRLPIDGVTHP